MTALVGRKMRSFVVPPSLGKTHVARTPWGRRHAIDTDHAIKLLNNEEAWDKGGREDWVIDGAISFTARAAQLRIRTGEVVILTNLHHVFDYCDTTVVLPKEAASYLSKARANRPDLSAFSDDTLLEWVENYRSFATRNLLRVVEIDGYLSELPELKLSIDSFGASN